MQIQRKFETKIVTTRKDTAMSVLHRFAISNGNIILHRNDYELAAMSRQRGPLKFIEHVFAAACRAMLWLRCASSAT